MVYGRSLVVCGPVAIIGWHEEMLMGKGRNSKLLRGSDESVSGGKSASPYGAMPFPRQSALVVKSREKPEGRWGR